eukprot:symbB.v1.2.035124.t2/scaffold4665.1/size36745/2
MSFPLTILAFSILWRMPWTDLSIPTSTAADRGDDKASELRETVAAVVLSDPDTWTEAMLGKAPEEYVEWIQDPQRWGGGIELAILAAHYATEIAAVDIQTLRISVFGEGQGFQNRAFVIYDGIHYDVLVRRGEQKLFETTDQGMLEEAIKVAKEAQTARNFTDVANFTLRCVVCQKGLTGQSDAVEHAKATGHANFADSLVQSPCGRAMLQWLLVPVLLLPEALLKIQAYQKPMTGTLLDLNLSSQSLRLTWGFHLNEGSALGYWMPRVQAALGYWGIKFMIFCGVLAAGFFVWQMQKVHSRSGQLGAIFLVSGAVGNLVDRLYVGGVIDYLLLQMHGLVNTSFFWNLSDLYIDFAVILLLLALARGDLGAESDEERTTEGTKKEH